MPTATADNTQSIYPGSIGFLFGYPPVPGFQGNGSALSATAITPEAIAGSAKSRSVVIPSRTPISNTQRTITWQVIGTGSFNFDLQVSIDNVDANFVTVDNYTGSGASGLRHVQADGATGAQSSGKILASARFIRAVEKSASPVTATVQVTAL